MSTKAACAAAGVPDDVLKAAEVKGIPWANLLTIWNTVVAVMPQIDAAVKFVLSLFQHLPAPPAKGSGKP